MQRAGLDTVHIDMMDGCFVPSLGIGTKLIESLRRVSGLIFDVHLMIREPGRFVERVASAGADRIIFHLEAGDDPVKILGRIRHAGCMTGLSIRPDTPVEALTEPLLREADVLHIMTTVPGVEGQSFQTSSLKRIAAVREKLNGLGLEREIEVDGGINADNLLQVLEAGADTAVVGRYLCSGGMAERIQFLRGRIERYEKEMAAGGRLCS